MLYCICVKSYSIFGSIHTNTMFGCLLLILSLYDIPGSQGYCSLIGSDPGFSAAPNVEQITLTSVLVSWQGIATKVECADQFIVKSWNARNPNDYFMSDLLPTTQFTYVVTDLVPNQNYVFQAVAREDKGFLGKDWNKSPTTTFKTHSQNPTVPPNNYINPSMMDPLTSSADTSSTKPPDILTLGAFVVGGLLAALIVIGVLWNICQNNNRKKTGDSESVTSDSDTDSMDLDLENTDLESRVGSIRPFSRTESRVSTIRSSTLRHGGTVRSRLRSPRRFSFTPSEPPNNTPSPTGGCPSYSDSLTGDHTIRPYTLGGGDTTTSPTTAASDV